MGRTESGGGFDHQAGVLLLELDRAEIAQCGMSSALIVDAVDKRGKRSDDVLEGFECHRIDRLDLERLHEALGFGVIVGISTPTHRADDAISREQLPITRSRVLRSAVRVMHETRRRSAARDGCFECGDRQACIDGSTDGIANDAAGTGIQDDRDLGEAACDRHVGQVRDPELVRSGQYERLR